MGRRLLLVACTLLVAACRHMAPPEGSGVTLPRLPAAEERLLIEVDVGVLGPGEELVLRTANGELVGTVSPHGIRAGHPAGTYVVPVPPAIAATHIVNHRLPVQILVERAGAAVRPARDNEVRGLRAIVVKP